jgi:hypothetical protein
MRFVLSFRPEQGWKDFLIKGLFRNFWLEGCLIVLLLFFAGVGMCDEVFRDCAGINATPQSPSSGSDEHGAETE